MPFRCPTSLDKALKEVDREEILVCTKVLYQSGHQILSLQVMLLCQVFLSILLLFIDLGAIRLRRHKSDKVLRKSGFELIRVI